jgi:lysophospholipase L1-like esterase
VSRRRSKRMLVVALVVALGAALVAIPTRFAWSGDTTTRSKSYYLALGDSLALGVQPDPSGVDQPTESGYADVLFDRLSASDPDPELVKLGCSGETTTTFVEGGNCSYGAFQSQLVAASTFLRAQRGQVKLVTIDLGGVDFGRCVSTEGIDAACVDAAIATIQRNLTLAIATLRTAAGPRVPIIGMNFYNPVLAAWLLGTGGQAIAKASLDVVDDVNTLLEQVYGRFRAPVADVETAFQTFTTTPVVVPGIGEIPVNVARICQWTWMCTPPPVGPNPHPNSSGYAVIADAFAAQLPADHHRWPW